MRRSHNEQGYALLIVLFLVVFIMAVSAVFIRGSLGNAKQEFKVDDSQLTVMAAEAGVDYYKTYVSNLYFSIIPDLETFVQNDIKKQLENPNNKAKVVDYNLTRKNTTSELERIFKEKEKILELTLEKNITLYNFKLKTTSVKRYPERHTVTVSGTSVGMGKGTEKKISFEQSFTIPDFSGASNSSGDGMSSPPNMHKLYPDNVNAAGCKSSKGGELKDTKCLGSKNGDYKEISNSTVYFEDGFVNNSGNLAVQNSIIFSKDGFDVKNFNQLTGSDLYIDYSFKAKNMNGIKNTTMRVNGAVNITSNMDMEGSTIIIRGSGRFNGHLNISKNSLVCVAGSLTVDKHLDIDAGSKLVHYASVAYGKKVGTGEIIQLNSEQEVWEKCKSENGKSISWHKPTIEDVIYE
ncbi:hypothetical protein [Sporosarcina sp. SAFN-015]|uniref:hypothetical protein n=1 Tax=Sporosarcina sp. SAFN-015 TaxID=3387274 RepID=UPI003F7D110A